MYHVYLCCALFSCQGQLPETGCSRNRSGGLQCRSWEHKNQFTSTMKKIPHIIFTWQRSADINILELLDGLPELDERGCSLPHHHRALVGPAGVKGEVVEGAVIDPLSEQCSLQSAGHQLLLKQGDTNVKQAILQSHMNTMLCVIIVFYIPLPYSRKFSPGEKKNC